MTRPWILPALLLLLAATPLARPNAGPLTPCGEVVTIETHGRSTTRYALSYPEGTPAQAGRIALVLLVGGGGRLNLDDKGCARELTGNSLVRLLPYFDRAGFVTALVDAPSDHPGDDGLAGFRITTEHAEDLGKVIVDMRTRTNAPIWLVGTCGGVGSDQDNYLKC
jgi:hypothetical protein